jgi:LEA14-like dessication related protein
MKNKINSMAYLFIMSIFLSSCSSVVQSVIDNIQYKVVKVDINIIKNSKNVLDAITHGDFEKLSKANITPNIQLTNNNSIDLSIGKTEYKVFIDELQVAEGITDTSLELKSNESNILLLPIDISLSKIAKNKLDILINHDMNRIKVEGKNYIKTISGEFVVSFTVHNNKVKVESIEPFSKE